MICHESSELSQLAHFSTGRARLDRKQVMALAFESALGATTGIIMVQLLRPRFAAALVIAAIIIASTTGTGWAFTQQMLGPNGYGNYDFNYSDPDHPATTGQSALPSDPNSPGLHFSIDHGQTSPFGGFQSGNRFDGNNGNPTDPRYYLQGNGN